MMRDVLSNQINIVGVNWLFVYVYINQDSNAKRFKTGKYYLRKGIIDNYSVIINGMISYDQFTDFDIKQYEEVRKWTKGKGKAYTTDCLLDYDYLKNCYRLIITD